jgi:hypothetical protein
MVSVQQIEKCIVWISAAFGFSLFAVAALAVGIFNIGLPTCITDIKPFQTEDVIVHAPNHYEVHWVARMWKFELLEIAGFHGTGWDERRSDSHPRKHCYRTKVSESPVGIIASLKAATATGYFTSGRGSGTNPLRFGIFTAGNVRSFNSEFSDTIPFSVRR